MSPPGLNKANFKHYRKPPAVTEYKEFPGRSHFEPPETAARGVLLATDLHAGNVLAAQRETWLARTAGLTLMYD